MRFIIRQHKKIDFSIVTTRIQPKLKITWKFSKIWTNKEIFMHGIIFFLRVA